MAGSNTDFLRFSAYSIKDLITRKLSENTKMTDQIYEGSNLAILIDIVSYMYQVLIQNLNTAAAESMFSDTQLYKNIVRLVKFIGYNPKGFNPSAITSYLTIPTSARGSILPAYSYIDTGLTDSNGRSIYFSTQKNTGSDTTTYDTLQSNTTQAFNLYNGKWKLYDTVYTASGIENETFSLDGLKSDSDDDKYVAHNFIDVYVRHYIDTVDADKYSTYFYDSQGKRYEWQRDWYLDLNGIFCGYQTDNSSGYMFNNKSAFKSLYPGDEHVYTVTLNENKQYELKFGNGVVGKKLDPGDIVYIFYLDSNGTEGKIDIHDIADTSKLKFCHSASDFGLSQKLYEELFQLTDRTSITEEWPDGAQISFKTSTATTAAEEETVEEIRTNAPMAFMTGNRLVTRTDYEYYLKNAHMTNIVGEDVVDVKCMNNWEYMASFYKWMYDLGANGKLVEYADTLDNGTVSDPTRYLQKNNFLRYDYFYADAADANNIYIWLKTPDGNFDVATTTANLNKQLNPIKIMTTELVACKAIDVNFSICAAPYEYALKQYFTDSFTQDTTFDEECESYIEVTLDDNAICVPQSLRGEIASVIQEAFDVNKCQFGQIVKFDGILNSIYAMDGVTRVRTIFKYYDDSGNERSRIYDGLSFASWSDTDGLIEYGDDLNISNTMRQLEDFQFPRFRDQDKAILADRIKIIKKSLSNVNTIKF